VKQRRNTGIETGRELRYNLFSEHQSFRDLKKKIILYGEVYIEESHAKKELINLYSRIRN
jgi:hypothetical protein